MVEVPSLGCPRRTVKCNQRNLHQERVWLLRKLKILDENMGQFRGWVPSRDYPSSIVKFLRCFPIYQMDRIHYQCSLNFPILQSRYLTMVELPILGYQ